MPIMIQQNAKCFSIPFTHVAHQSQLSLTTDYWPLTTAVPGGRAYSALPCAGAPPPQRPRSCSRRSEFVRNTKLASRGDPSVPHLVSWRVPGMCQRKQGGRGNAQLGPTYTAITIKSPLHRSWQYTPDKQTAHRIWLGSYAKTPKQPRTSRRAHARRESSC